MDNVTPIGQAAQLALAAPLRQESQSLDYQQDLVRARLEPASPDDFRNQLTACLALCAPSGMSADDRKEWMKAAWGTLRDVPTDLLMQGCDAARRQADHPSKIVPIIVAEIEQQMAWRMSGLRSTGERMPVERQIEKPDYITPEQAAAIRKEYGI